MHEQMNESFVSVHVNGTTVEILVSFSKDVHQLKPTDDNLSHHIQTEYSDLFTTCNLSMTLDDGFLRLCEQNVPVLHGTDL